MFSFRIRVYLAIFIGVLALGTVGFTLAEDLSPLDALYFTVVTVSTVGYGDIQPATPAGKGGAIGIIVVGVGTFLGAIASIAEAALSRRERRAGQRHLARQVAERLGEH